VARLRAWATVVATISLMAAGAEPAGLTFSHTAVAGLETLQLHGSRETVPLRGFRGRPACICWWQTTHHSFSTSTEEA
jgi:hypothetical protein